jgi:hypothetical protein
MKSKATPLYSHPVRIIKHYAGFLGGAVAVRNAMFGKGWPAANRAIQHRHQSIDRLLGCLPRPVLNAIAEELANKGEKMLRLVRTPTKTEEAHK